MWMVVVTALVFGANPYLPQAREAVQQMHYGQARAQLDLAMGVTTSSRDEKRELAHLSALVWAAEGKLAKAEAEYEALLAADPSAPAPQAGPPRLRDAFRRVKERLYPLGYVGLVERPAPEGRVAVALTDPWALVSTLVLTQSFETRAEAELLLADEAGLASGTLLPGARSWFVEARGPQGAALAHLGTREAPRLLALPEPVAAVGLAPGVTPARSRVLPWLVTVAAVGLLATAGVFAGLGAGSSASAGSADFASEVRAFDLRARSQLSFAWGFGIAGVVAGAGAVVLWVW